MLDPPVRMTIDGKLASFWYNPYQGIVRARVPVCVSDRKALDLYNSINGTRLSELYGAPPEPPRESGPALPSGAEKPRATAEVPEQAPDLGPSIPRARPKRR